MRNIAANSVFAYSSTSLQGQTQNRRSAGNGHGNNAHLAGKEAVVGANHKLGKSSVLLLLRGKEVERAAADGGRHSGAGAGRAKDGKSLCNVESHGCSRGNVPN
jgi:hypothetical protein